jgi:cell wall assembly regulator SMI1
VNVPLPPDPLAACHQAPARIAASDDEDLAGEVGGVAVLLVLGGHREQAGRIWRAAIERDVAIGVFGSAGEVVADAWHADPFWAQEAELDEINTLVSDGYATPRPTALPDASEGEHLQLQRWRWAQGLAGSAHVPPGEEDLDYGRGYEPRDEPAAAAVLHDLLAGLDLSEPPHWAPDAFVLAAFLAARAGRPETARTHLRSWVLLSRATGGECRAQRLLVLSPLRSMILEGALSDALGIGDAEAAEIADQVIAALGERIESGTPTLLVIEDLDAFLDEWFEELRARGVVPSDAVQPAGATDERIAATEARLGVRLPPDYADFLRATDGWPSLSDQTPGLRSVDRIDWFRAAHQDWIDVYTEEGEEEGDIEWNRELGGALQISDEGDSVVFLLNPQVTDSDGNWEPWIFGNWIPGADRFRSFGELLSYMRGDEDDEA